MTGPSMVLDVPNHGIHQEQKDRLCQIVTPMGMFGYGFQEKLTLDVLQSLDLSTPTAIIVDAGSTDSGASKLALGDMTVPRTSYVRDLEKLLQISVEFNIPVLISSAGGAGSDEHVDEFVKIISEIADKPANRSWSLKLIAIYASIDKNLVLNKLEQGQISGCGPTVPTLVAEDVQTAPRIVAQMGPEPFLQAMVANPGFNVVISGRAYDPSPHVAFAAYHALKRTGDDVFALNNAELGALTHMGKIMECGGVCGTPKSSGALSVVYKDFSFDIVPLEPHCKCTALSVAAHTLYEKSRPDILHGPGGYIDLSSTTYEELRDGRTVRVRGASFHPSRAGGLSYTLKLEGARVTGFRTLVLGSFRDPILISQMDDFLVRVRAYVTQQNQHIDGTWKLGFHLYGFDKKHLTSSEVLQKPPKEVFLVAEALGETQALANSVAAQTRIACAHAAYPGQKATSGNFSMGIGGKFVIETGACCEFSLYHLMPVEEGAERAVEISKHNATSVGLFRWTVLSIGHGKEPTPNGSASTVHLNGKDAATKNGVSAAKNVIPSSPRATALPRTLFDICEVIRSKNAGPFEITMDVMFDNPEVYAMIKRSGLLSPDVIAKAYDIEVGDIIWCGFFDVALAFKATIPRLIEGKGACSGGYMEDDVHGAGQYTLLMNLPLSDALIQEYLAITQI